jgi:hypothetical protein
MDQLFSSMPILMVYLVGAVSLMAGAILFLGALLLKPKKPINPIIPTMRTQARTIPPRYDAKLQARERA